MLSGEDPARAPMSAMAVSAPPRRQNLFELAYEKIESGLVNCSLAPGRELTMNDLMQITGLGRTPVHHAVNRFAADTLIVIRPRHGLRIAPINLTRERTLLRLRRDLERFVVRLAAERCGAAKRSQLSHLERLLRERRDAMGLEEFNAIDRAIDRLILAAAKEPFLEHTLRPLHTFFRRIGYLYHTQPGIEPDLSGTIDHHVAVVGAIIGRDPERAVRASDALVDFMDTMFDAMEARIDPALLDGGQACASGA